MVAQKQMLWRRAVKKVVVLFRGVIRGHISNMFTTWTTIALIKLAITVGGTNCCHGDEVALFTKQSITCLCELRETQKKTSLKGFKYPVKSLVYKYATTVLPEI